MLLSLKKLFPRFHFSFFICCIFLASACNFNTTPPSADQQDEFQAVIVVTPTRNPTAIPTLAPITPTARPSSTPIVTITPTEAEVLACDVVLDQLYETSTLACLEAESGLMCNGGTSSEIASGDTNFNSMTEQGALVEVATVDSIHTAPLLTENSGGLVWVRQEVPERMTILLIGEVDIQSISDNPSAPWEAMIVTTTPNASDCTILPQHSLVIQSPYGLSSTVNVNGVTIAVSGTTVVQTIATETAFIALEGFINLSAGGQSRLIYAGQQLSLTYAEDDFSRPIATLGNPTPLQFDRIANLPIMLLDRPVLLPQPGYVATEALVNMRGAPNLNGQLLFQIPGGQIMSVLGKSSDNEWFHTRLGNGDSGWMKADLLTQRLGPITAVYDEIPEPPKRYADIEEQASVAVPAGGNLREGPDVNFDIVAGVPNGAPVELLARSPYSAWVKVRYADLVGWMAIFTIETRSAIGLLPLDFNTPVLAGPTEIPVFEYGGGHAYPDPSSGF